MIQNVSGENVSLTLTHCVKYISNEVFLAGTAGGHGGRHVMP